MQATVKSNDNGKHCFDRERVNKKLFNVAHWKNKWISWPKNQRLTMKFVEKKKWKSKYGW